MTSIGNDVVDLNFVDKARSHQPRFYSKFLSLSECEILSDAALSTQDCIKYIWLLWSAKEAIYKFAKRLKPDLIFSPAKIILRSESSDSENSQDQIVHQSKFWPSLNSENSDSDIFLNFTFQSKTYYTRSTVTSNYISTIANNVTDFSGLETGVSKLEQSDYTSQSAGVRRALLEQLFTLYPDQTFQIGKSQIGYPVVESSKSGAAVIASFAHHGNYVAYAFKK